VPVEGGEGVVENGWAIAWLLREFKPAGTIKQNSKTIRT
jgi:hypothetical protein